MGASNNKEYDREQEEIIYYVILACSALSICGSLFILLLCVIYPKLRRLPFRLILFLAIADLGVSISYILPFYKSNAICQAQGYLESYFSLSSIFWSACISHAIKSTILQNKNVQQNLKKYLIICFFIPLSSYLVLIDIHEYDVSLGWCWIYLDPNASNSIFYRQLAYRLITYYLPLSFVIIFIILNYISVISALKKSKYFFGTNSKISETMILKLKLYPLILIISVFPVSILRISSIWVTPTWYFAMISGGFLSVGGFLNSIVYGLTQDVRNELKKTFGIKQPQELKSLTQI